MATPARKCDGRCPRPTESRRASENSDPNLPAPTPPPKPTKPSDDFAANSAVKAKPSKSPAAAPKSKRSATRTPDRLPQDGKSAASKKSSRRFAEVAYDAPRAPLEELFQADQPARTTIQSKDGPQSGEKIRVSESSDQSAERSNLDELEGSSKTRKMRSMMLEEAMSSVPEPGAGRVMYLVKTFERLLSLSSGEEDDGCKEERRRKKKKKKVINWALPGLHPPPRADETEVSYSPVSSSWEFFPTNNSEVAYSSKCSSVDSNGVRGSKATGGGQRKRRNSTGSSGRNWNQKLRVTNQQPFKLRTEQRGRIKEEQFVQKVKEMLQEEERLRIPIAQGLPWTTDEPECLVKHPTKEPTEPIDLILHSDVRAVERAEFDVHVANRLHFIEQIKMERERLQKMEEEEEIRKLRKELVPKAQPMPYFDRPFVPKRSMRPKTVPKEPRFQARPSRHAPT